MVRKGLMWVTATTARVVLVTMCVCAPLSIAAWSVVGRTYQAFVRLYRVEAQSDLDHHRLDQVVEFLNAQIAAAAKK